jgi:hypothetical protein
MRELAIPWFLELHGASQQGVNLPTILDFGFFPKNSMAYMEQREYVCSEVRHE